MDKKIKPKFDGGRIYYDVEDVKRATLDNLEKKLMKPDLITRVLELDEKGTAEPWEAFEEREIQPEMGWPDPQPAAWEPPYFTLPGDEVGYAMHVFADVELIAEYRSAAPKLARALEIAMEGLQNCHDVDRCGYPHLCESCDAIDEIHKMLGEG